MKLILNILTFVYTFSCYSQTTYIPDSVFETYLEDTYPSCDDGSSNNYVLTSGLSDVTSIIILSGSWNYGISDLTGIEYCHNLNYLQIGVNSLITELDLSTFNDTPEGFWIDISGVINLNTFKLPSTPLKFLKIASTDISEIIFTSSNNLTGASPSISITDNSNLSLLDLSLITIPNNSISFFSIRSNPSLSCINMAADWSDGYSMANVDIGLNDVLTEIVVIDPLYCNDAANWGWDEQALFELYNPGEPNPFKYVTISNSASCTSLSINEYQTELKELIKIVDLMGRETVSKPNEILIYLYSDGTSEKVFVTE